MTPHRCFRGVLKDSTVPIERLSKACFSEAHPINRAVLEPSFHTGIAYMHRPREDHEAVVGLDPGQARASYWSDCWSQWTSHLIGGRPCVPKATIDYRSHARLVVRTMLHTSVEGQSLPNPAFGVTTGPPRRTDMV